MESTVHVKLTSAVFKLDLVFQNKRNSANVLIFKILLKISLQDKQKTLWGCFVVILFLARSVIHISLF